MPTPLTRTIDYPIGVERLYAALTTEKYWQERMTQVGGEGSIIESLVITPNSVAARVVNVIAEADLPSEITVVRKGDLLIDRTETWETLSASGGSGTFSASVQGAPATLHGTNTLTGGTGAATVNVNGEAVVKIPFIGGKIEQGIIDNITNLFDAERQFTLEWIDNNL